MNIFSMIILVLETEQLVGRQHLYMLSYGSSSLNATFHLGLYRLILTGVLVMYQWRGPVLQLTGCPLG